MLKRRRPLLSREWNRPHETYFVLPGVAVPPGIYFHLSRVYTTHETYFELVNLVPMG